MNFKVWHPPTRRSEAYRAKKVRCREILAGRSETNRRKH
jgi:hypothetical protein